MAKKQSARQVPDKANHFVSVDAIAIRRQLEDLKQAQRALEALLASAEEVDSGNSDSGRASAATARRFGLATDSRDMRKQRPVREVILDALQDLGFPAYSRELALYCKARYGRDIPATRFGTLGADEEKAYLRPNRRPDALGLCFAVTYDRYQPIKRLLARSDWSLDMRVVAPTTGRVQNLLITRRLCEICLEVDDIAADPEMMKIIAADHAQGVLGVKVERGEFDLEKWRQAADSKLAELLPEDKLVREKAAERLAKFSKRVQLFGTFDVIEGGLVDGPRIRGEA